MTDARIAELARSYTAVVADALDAVGLRDQTLDPAVRPLRRTMTFAARAFPVVVDASTDVPEEPYDREMSAIEALTPGFAPVMVVDPSSRAAVWGELFSCAAIGRGARGAIVDGYIRDARQIAALPFPVFCRGLSPLDTLGRADVRVFGTQAVCGGVTVSCGDYLLADEDGIVAVPETAIDSVLAIIREKAPLEKSAKEDLLGGVAIREVWTRYGVF
jgi:4-hydroxy-4-methyl-2-oxoglutarate aldolase